MNANEFDSVKTSLRATADTIAMEKRPGYTVGNEDVLHNFKSVAERVGITPMQAFGVYFLKHIDAITALIKDPNIPQAENVMGRFADAHNYLDLGFGLWVEEAPPHARPLPDPSWDSTSMKVLPMPGLATIQAQSKTTK